VIEELDGFFGCDGRECNEVGGVPRARETGGLSRGRPYVETLAQVEARERFAVAFDLRH